MKGQPVNKVEAYNIYSSSGSIMDSTYPQSIKIRKDFKNISTLGVEYQLYIDFTPSDVNQRDIKWTSSDESILVIDENGKAYAKKKGTVKVTATTINGKTDSITLTVNSTNSTSGQLDGVKYIEIKNSPKVMLTNDSFTLNTKLIIKEMSSGYVL